MVFQPNQTRHPDKSPGSGDQVPARALALQDARATLSHSIALRTNAKQLTARIRKFYATLGGSAAMTLGIGAALAVLCTVWAIQLDVPYQVAFLAGYITLAATACVCAALVAVRHSTPKTKPAKVAPRAKSVVKPDGPDYTVWKRVGTLRVADASRLWCGIEPGRHATPEVMDWARAILEALERGELPKSESTGVLAQYKIGWHTEIQRDALKAWAQSKGHVPPFLCD